MRISLERLAAEAQETGFRPEILEKVIHLLRLLETTQSHPYLRGRLVLKGGTALNLFLFNVPRLSVDIDLNYVGGEALEVMEAERPRVEEALQAVFAREGHNVVRLPRDHAGGEVAAPLPQCHRPAGEHRGRPELHVPCSAVAAADLRLTDRRLLLGPGIPVLDVHELAAGKLAARERVGSRPTRCRSTPRCGTHCDGGSASGLPWSTTTCSRPSGTRSRPSPGRSSGGCGTSGCGGICRRGSRRRSGVPIRLDMTSVAGSSPATRAGTPRFPPPT